jgi:hypothetical protein
MKDRFVLFSVAGILAMVMLVSWARIDAEKAPRFVVGQVYAFAIDCGIRVGVGRDETSGVAVPIEINDCYTEPLRVRKVLDDGWLEVIDMRDEKPKPTVWMVNPARAWGYAPVANPHERVALFDVPHEPRGR